MAMPQRDNVIEEIKRLGIYGDRPLKLWGQTLNAGDVSFWGQTICPVL